nr:response regulator transcription factor [Fusobacterium necrophorum]
MREKKVKVLIVEDDLEIQNLIAYFFKKEGYEVEKASNGLEALKQLKKNSFDFLILDWMLPSLDGSQLTKIIREMPEEYGSPFVIMVTAKTETEDVLEGFTFGADEYVKKPFDPRELLARAKKLLQNKIPHSKNSFHFQSLILDDRKHLVTWEGIEVDLSKKEYDLLLTLLVNQGLVITREKILDEVWGSTYYIGDRTVDVYISKLREKLPGISTSIKTVKGVGYKLEEKKS